jgi:hypothetical protein
MLIYLAKKNQSYLLVLANTPKCLPGTKNKKKKKKNFGVVCSLELFD